MGKPKTGSVPNKALYSRVSYLYQAAAYLATQQQSIHTVGSTTTAVGGGKGQEVVAMTSEKLPDSRSPLSRPASRRLVSDLRAVSHKIFMRISPTMKHSLCKSCNTMMIDGDTYTIEIENRSKGGKKPWADIFVRRCNTCGQEKRFPLASERQKRRPQRMAPQKIESEQPS